MEENKNIEMRAETPSFVYRDGMTANIEYVEWLSEVKAQYMKQWYSFYYDRFTKSHQNGGQMPTAGKSHQVGGQSEMPEKFGVYTDKTIVEWSLQDIQKPLGVASYQLQEVVERTIAEIENNK